MQWSGGVNLPTQELWSSQCTASIIHNTTCPIAAWIWSPCLWIRRKAYKTKYRHKTLVFPLQKQAVHIANSFHVNLHLQPDNRLELSSNQAWLNLEDFFPTGEPFPLSRSKHDFVLSLFPFFIFIPGFFFPLIIIIMNKLVLNQFQQLELIFLLLTLHLGLSRSGRLSISINITESSGICINVLLTSWQSFGTSSWDLRSKGGKKACIIPYPGRIVRSCQVKPQVSFPTTKIRDKISTPKQVHGSDNLSQSLPLASERACSWKRKLFNCYLAMWEVLRCQILHKVV